MDGWMDGWVSECGDYFLYVRTYVREFRGALGITTI